MRETFPKKNRGDSLTHQHVNDLSSVARRFSDFRVSGGLSLNHGESFVSLSTLPPFTQYILEVSNTKINDEDTDDSGFYLGKVRYYSASDSEWNTNDDREWEVDVSGVSYELRVGDIIVAWWDEQRGMFTPTVGIQSAFRGVLDGALDAGDFAVVSLWKFDGIDADMEIDVTAYDWFLGGGESIDAGTKVIVTWFPNDNRWYVTGAAC